MQIGSIPLTYCGSFLLTLTFSYRGSPQQVERPHSQRRNRCKLILSGQIAGLCPRRIIARLVTAIVPFMCPMAAYTALSQPPAHHLPCIPIPSTGSRVPLQSLRLASPFRQAGSAP